MKLYDLTELIENNNKYVLLKIKDNVSKINLIKIDGFNGCEEIIKLTKGDNHICTILAKDNKSYSWEWGTNGFTLISNGMKLKQKTIVNCIKNDFKINIENEVE